MHKRICVVGGGRWGQNHIRTLFQMGSLAGIVDADPGRLQDLLIKFPVQGFADLEEALTVGFDGYVLATPAPTHYGIGKRLLELGTKVLIEKPMTLSSVEAAELVAIARDSGSSLMVGHLLLFHPAIAKIKELITDGLIGNLYYVYSTRLNMGTIRTEENVFWSFAPHDISVLDYLIGRPAEDIKANGANFLQKGIPDMVMAQLKYPDNIHAHIHVSWLHPFKEQRLVVIGSKGMLVFEDSSVNKNIIHYSKSVDWINGKPIIAQQPDEIIPYEKSMPLNNELQYFIDHMDTGFAIADGRSGYEVVKVLESVQAIIKQEEKH